MKNARVLLTVAALLAGFECLHSSCSDKRYPCPAYASSTQAGFDSTGAFTGGGKSNKDPKTGLIKKKKNKKLLDRRNNAKVF